MPIINTPFPIAEFENDVKAITHYEAQIRKPKCGLWEAVFIPDI